MPRPGVYVPITDRKTNKTYNMPWHDVTVKPNRQEIESFIYDQEHPSMMDTVVNKVFAPTTRFISEGIKRRVAEPLLKYSEGEPLQMFGKQMGPGLEEAQKKYPEGSFARKYSDFDRSFARYGGAFASTVSDELDNLTSPGSLALTLAGPVGKVGQAAGGTNVVGRAGTALTKLPRAAGAGMLAHGAYGAEEAIRNPSGGGFIEDIKGPALEMGMGALGTFGGRKPSKPAGLNTKVAKVNPTGGDFGIPGMPAGERPLQRGVNSNFPYNAPATERFRPNLGEILDEPVARPTGQTTTSQGLLGGQSWTPAGTYKASISGTGERPNMTPVTEAPYITQIKEAFDKAVPKTEAPPRPTPKDMTPEGLGRRFQQMERETTEGRLRAEVEAENRAAGFPESKVKSKKPDVHPTEDVVQAENLRNPWAEERAKYSKAVLDAIDTETLNSPELMEGMHKGVVADIRKRLGKKAPGYVEPPPTKPKAKPAKYKTFKERFASERGAVDIDLEGLADDFQSGVGKLTGKLGDLRRKGLQNIADAEATGIFGKATKGVTLARKGATALTGSDITDASLRSYLQSGWAYLEKQGKPGREIARILKRQRMDVSAEIERAKARGEFVTNEAGDPINRIGGLINERHGARIRELMKQIPEGEGRNQAQAVIDEFIGKNRDSRKAFSPGIDAIRGIQGATKLSQFSIANPAGIVPITMRGNLRSVAKNIKRVLPGIGDFKQAELEARPSGYIHDVAGSAMDETGKKGLAKIVDKMFRITGSEKRMRTLATLVGRDTAENLFQSLKANPTSKALRKQLDDLILEDDLDRVLRQNTLTEEQSVRAGGRMNELTQGIAEGIDLPPQWTGSASADLMTQFKKYGFVQTRNMKEAFWANPGKTLAAAGIVAPVVGEAIGDVKATIKGATRNVMSKDDQEKMIDTIMEEIKQRGTGGERYANDMSQAWALGLFGDILKGASRGDRGLLETISGPFWGDLSEAAFGFHELFTKGQSFRLRRQLARAIPFVGTGVASTIKGEYTGRQGRRPRRKRSRRTP